MISRALKYLLESIKYLYSGDDLNSSKIYTIKVYSKSVNGSEPKLLKTVKVSIAPIKDATDNRNTE